MERFLQMVEKHEGWGIPKKDRTGHAQMLKNALIKNNGEYDPRKQLEKIFAKDRSEVQKRIDAKLWEIEQELITESKDPLEIIWQGILYFYDPLERSWIKNPEFTVPQQ